MTALVEHFDHFVMPVDDIVAAEEFYIDVLGARIALNSKGKPARAGLSVRYFREGVRPLTFFSLAGKRIGVYLQSELRPVQRALRGAPTYTFETTAGHFPQIVARLENNKIAFEGPLDDPVARAHSAVFFNDPAGNHLAIYVPHSPTAMTSSSRDGSSGITAVGYIQLEAPSLEASCRFYADTFGLPEPEFGRDPLSAAQQASFTLPSGQRLDLIEGPFSPKGMRLSRTEPGPHLAFYVPFERWGAMLDNLSSLNILHGDRAAEAKGRTPDQRDTYLDDPAGYVIQLISAIED
jgi:catechol 2,3-dioxygenase-like lactoylglutathione lyase family enzyme